MTQQKLSKIKKRAEAASSATLADSISKAFIKYTDWFGEPPHGTVVQMASMLDFLPEKSFIHARQDVTELVAWIEELTLMHSNCFAAWQNQCESMDNFKIKLSDLETLLAAKEKKR